MNEDIFKGYGIEVELVGDDSFLKIKETLTRIGIASKKENTLYQSCHILHKRGRYSILHFKELFMLDGKTSDFTDEDKSRRNAITNLLDQWGLIKVIDKSDIDSFVSPNLNIKVLPHKEKVDWNLVSKYTVGKK